MYRVISNPNFFFPCTHPTISGIISGKTQLTKRIAFLIEKTYGISSDWLLNGNGKMSVDLGEEEKKIQEENALLRKID